jgi:hypothetical protein
MAPLSVIAPAAGHPATCTVTEASGIVPSLNKTKKKATIH